MLHGSDESFRVPKAAEIIAEKLRRSIVEGTLKPGDMLPAEARLIEMFDVSRPTIREAIRILEFENLIAVSRGARGGAMVQAPSPQFVARAMGVALQSVQATLDDLFRARSEIEPAAARMAAQDRPKEAGSALLAHVQFEREQFEKSVEITVHTANFHRLLLTECGNKTFGLLGVALHDLVSKHQRLYHRVLPADVEETRKRTLLGIRSHEKLAEFIRQGQGQEAEAHWRRHMEKVASIIVSPLSGTTVIEVLETKV